jgi:hypothetical protein
MMHQKLKILCYVAISLMLLFSPFLLDSSPDGKANAMGFLGSSGGGDGSSNSPIVFSTPASGSDTSPTLGPGGPDPTTRVPEPATLILFGAGVISLAVFKKKLKKQ